MENTELIFRAVNFAKRNATESGITAEDVAKNAGFSIDYFNRIFSFSHRLYGHRIHQLYPLEAGCFSASNNRSIGA